MDTPENTSKGMDTDMYVQPWDITQDVKWACDIPEGLLGENIGAIALSRGITDSEVVEAAKFLVEKGWHGQARTQAQILVEAQQLGHGKQSPKLVVRSERRRFNGEWGELDQAMERLRMARRGLAQVRTAEDLERVQARISEAQAEFDRLLAEKKAEIKRAEGQLPIGIRQALGILAGDSDGSEN